MPYQYIVLDSYPLSNAVVAHAAIGTIPNSSQQCRKWIDECERAGTIFIVPAIAYYEEVREMELRRAAKQITRLQTFCFNPERFIPLTTNHLSEAAKLWAHARQRGQPTADRHSLDGDAIFAAQVLSLNLADEEYIVATRNVKHVARFGLRADEWQNIDPL